MIKMNMIQHNAPAVIRMNMTQRNAQMIRMNMIQRNATINDKDEYDRALCTNKL